MKGSEKPKAKQRKKRRKKGKSLTQLMKEKVELERELDECSLAEFRLAEAVLEAAFILEKKRKPFYIR